MVSPVAMTARASREKDVQHDDHAMTEGGGTMWMRNQPGLRSESVCGKGTTGG